MLDKKGREAHKSADSFDALRLICDEPSESLIWRKWSQQKPLRSSPSTHLIAIKYLRIFKVSLMHDRKVLSKSFVRIE
jgi:hypothetical protein